MSGGYGGGVPPLPIPNREVKPACADGTAMQCGRVGGRLLFTTSRSPEDRDVFGTLFLRQRFLDFFVLWLSSMFLCEVSCWGFTSACAYSFVWHVGQMPLIR